LFAFHQSEYFRIDKNADKRHVNVEKRSVCEIKKNELKKAKLIFKKRKMFIIFISIKFNDEVISLIEIINKSNYILSFTQFKQFDQIRLINVSISIDLISSKNQIRKSVISKNQYVTQRIREIYIAIMFQSKVNFNLSLIVQVINFKEEDAKRLNKRFQ
jgi:hypothetical protein